MRSFDSIVVRHVYREANGVAHRLTTFAKGSVMDDFWLAEIPSIIEDVLYENCCYDARGFDFMSLSKSNIVIS